MQIRSKEQAKDVPQSPAPQGGQVVGFVGTRASLGQARVIYGQDDRKDVYQADAKWQALAKSTATLVDAYRVTPSGNGKMDLKTSSYNVCADEPFAEQKTLGFCSASLVGDDLVLTAGHCVNPNAEGGTKVVFGFGIQNAGGETPASVSQDDVYTVKKVVRKVLDSNTKADWALLRLDRPVTGRTALPVSKTPIANGTPVTVIGHPAGLPTKVAGGANVRDNSPASFFTTNLDTYGGNSGSAVFNDKGEIEGVLVRGETDYVYDPQRGCRISNRIGDGAGRGEDVTKIALAADAIEEAKRPGILERIGDALRGFFGA